LRRLLAATVSKLEVSDDAPIDAHSSSPSFQAL
jgi:hypothetical protein